MANLQEMCHVAETSQVPAYLPTILNAISADPNHQFNVHCAICGDLLNISSSISSRVPAFLSAGGQSSSHLPFYEAHHIEQTAVLFCGHVIGYECYKTFFASRYGDWAAVEIYHALISDDDHEADIQESLENPAQDPASCPICRMVLRFRDCKHAIPVKSPFTVAFPLHEDSFDLRKGLEETVPLTLPEGAAIPGFCAECGNRYADMIEQEYWRPKCMLCVRQENKPEYLERDLKNICGNEVAQLWRESKGEDHAGLARLYKEVCLGKHAEQMSLIAYPRREGRDVNRQRAGWWHQNLRSVYRERPLQGEVEGEMWSICKQRNAHVYHTHQGACEGYRDSGSQRRGAAVRRMVSWLDRNSVELEQRVYGMH
ncbi:hypothetical protein TruAng_007875 [Truncatella angustata]|nr:hypothetical protein TruAng_007875 [Truncatella angustata]